VTERLDNSTGSSRQVLVELDLHPFVGSTGWSSSRASRAP
jgi:hypothetical protein